MGEESGDPGGPQSCKRQRPNSCCKEDVGTLGCCVGGAHWRERSQIAGQGDEEDALGQWQEAETLYLVTLHVWVLVQFV